MHEQRLKPKDPGGKVRVSGWTHRLPYLLPSFPPNLSSEQLLPWYITAQDKCPGPRLYVQATCLKILPPLVTSLKHLSPRSSWRHPHTPELAALAGEEAACSRQGRRCPAPGGCCLCPGGKLLRGLPSCWSIDWSQTPPCCASCIT